LNRPSSIDVSSRPVQQLAVRGGGGDLLLGQLVHCLLVIGVSLEEVADAVGEALVLAKT